MDAGAPIAVLIADEDPLSRGEVRRALRPAADISVVGLVDDADAAARCMESRHVDVVVSGETSPSGQVQSLAPVSNAPGSPALLVLVRRWSEDGALTLLRAGADGVLPKDADPAALPRVVRAAAAGEMIVPRTLVRTLVTELRSADRHRGPRFTRRDLTERQWQVIDLVAAGLTTEEIAGELDLRVETVRSHIKHLLQRLGVHTRAEALEAVRETRERRRVGAT
ncbi:LuxR C-terminal-related transcriptional regulator [Paraconexibacter sp.]|uniref:LuxR C-terminal-related transcriptional regulator n=1 Tax=Paraconexibacter sp. TaxID=2949640 RepID=UPI003566772D